HVEQPDTPENQIERQNIPNPVLAGVAVVLADIAILLSYATILSYVGRPDEPLATSNLLKLRECSAFVRFL
uniref:hypothetical protein n=1 Tax=Alicyclobacillus suci TaxID=2816080 RepID=UPI001A90122B